MIPGATISIRDAQVLAARCVADLSIAFEIYDGAIDDLVKHLVDLASATDLSAWNSRGSALEVSGRGDPFPSRFYDRLGQARASDFSRLIENAVEVGIHDLYGAPTGKPLGFLKECFQILGKWGVTAPSDLPSGVNGYGPPV